MEQQPKKQYVSAIDRMELYRRASVVLRVKLGLFGKAMTQEEKKFFYEEERKIWLAYFSPQKLKDEYGITLSQSYDCDNVNGIVDEIINYQPLTT